MRHDPEFDLRVVGHQENPAFPGNEPGADGFATGGSDRNVLQVGLGRAEPSGGRTRLIEGRVDPASAGVDPLRQRIDIRALELLELTILEDQTGQLMSHRRKLLENIRICGRTGLGFLQDWKLMLLEQNGGKLPWRIEVQVGACYPR